MLDKKHTMWPNKTNLINAKYGGLFANQVRVGALLLLGNNSNSVQANI